MALPYRLIKLPRCAHVCACGAMHVCRSQDQCIVPNQAEPYVCPACDLDALDDYLNRLEPATAHIKETTHEGH